MWKLMAAVAVLVACVLPVDLWAQSEGARGKIFVETVVPTGPARGTYTFQVIEPPEVWDGIIPDDVPIIDQILDSCVELWDVAARAQTRREAAQLLYECTVDRILYEEDGEWGRTGTLLPPQS